MKERVCVCLQKVKSGAQRAEREGDDVDTYTPKHLEIFHATHCKPLYTFSSQHVLGSETVLAQKVRAGDENQIS